MENKTKLFKQFISYLFVGGGATVVEWLCFYLFHEMWYIQYLLATALAFIFSTFANWLLGRIFTFKDSKKNILLELLQIYIVSIGGLIFNLIIMYLLVSHLEVKEMFSKMIATCIVFMYNFLIRKFLIYRKDN